MPIVGVLIMLFSAVVNFLFQKNCLCCCKKADSIAVEADAWHLRADIYTSLGVMVALFIITIVEFLILGKNIYWLDSVAVFIVALMLL
jgi:divalent metal cation (Fe/Co/Zn/Cd) transporter